MTGKGVVVKTNGSTATVSIQKASACGHNCGECQLCSNPKIEAEILNPINASVGDTVIIGMDSKKVLMWAFILYILPILGAMIFYTVSIAFTKSLALSVIITSLWVIVWFFAIRRYSKNKISLSSALEVVYEEN